MIVSPYFALKVLKLLIISTSTSQASIPLTRTRSSLSHGVVALLAWGHGGNGEKG
jgi:hypothetical protein